MSGLTTCPRCDLTLPVERASHTPAQCVARLEVAIASTEHHLRSLRERMDKARAVTA